MNKAKVWESAVIDFAIVAVGGYLSWPQDTDITVRMCVTLLATAGLQVLKGLKTYHATHPDKVEVQRR